MSHATKEAKAPLDPVQTENVPDYLVKEEIEGVKYYYKGYRDVLDKTKKPQDIMGCSSLQSLIIEYLLDLLHDEKVRSKYRRFTNESGNHLAQRSNMQFDIAVYSKSVLTADKISRKYVQGIPPELVVEVDLDVELEGTGIEGLEEFLIYRTEKLLEYGVKKVLWILTNAKKVVVAEGKTWRIENWDKDLELLEGSRFNIAKYLEQEGVDPDAV
jgi:Uma2 family endonuclease